MGKFKFTLVNLWYWASMVFVCFLAENMLFLTPNPKAGFDIPTLAILTFGSVASLFMFFFLNHKRNKMSFDWVLLSAIATVGCAMILGIWLNGDTSYSFANGENNIAVTFTIYEKVRATIILIVFLAFTYGFMFVFNMNRVRHRRMVWFAYAGIIAALISIIYSLCTEMDVYVAIFKNEALPNASIDSFYGNKNYYGGVLFIGILACIFANYYKPRLHLYLLSVVMFVILLSTCAMLPTLIMVCALPIYLFEEVLRFAIKKKWKACIFALVAILSFMALAIVFYYGCKKEWDGFNGLDIYMTETFNKKNFSTLSGRTQIWENILPLCYDSPLHIIIGHGFLISEKNIYAITAAMNNSMEGVRTTHNGYLQIFFEYGVIGFATFALLFGYFVYCCIRLLMEKRWHFVFIHFFLVLCCAAYNFCESSSFFDAGVKEIYMTTLFVMPVVAEYKMLKRVDKVEEIKNYNDEHKTDYIKLGQTIAVLIMLVLVTSATMFISSITYEMPWLKTLLLNVLIGSAICLLFVPYLVALYYKNSEKLHFILHISFNGILIGAVLALIYILFRSEHSLKPMIPYFLPGLLFLILLLETVVYSLIKNGSIKEWIKVFVVGSFKIPCFGILGAVLFGGISTLVVQTLNINHLYLYLAILGITLFGYVFGFTIYQLKPTRELIEDWNEIDLSYNRRLCVEEEKYDG